MPHHPDNYDHQCANSALLPAPKIEYRVLLRFDGRDRRTVLCALSRSASRAPRLSEGWQANKAML